MATKIRLQRHGKKGSPFYYIVVADARAPRDGRFIERLGSYNPNTNPATIDINFDKTLDWVNSGAQPTDTCRAILSYKGVLYKKHLEGGVKKGALTEEQAVAKFEAWLEQKNSKITGKKESLTTAKQDARKAALAAEAKKKEIKAASIIAKNTPPVEEAEVAEEEAEIPVAVAETEEPVAEVAAVEAEAPVAEEVVEAPVAEAPVAEAEVETPATEAEAEAPAAEAETETPAEDAE